MFAAVYGHTDPRILLMPSITNFKLSQKFRQRIAKPSPDAETFVSVITGRQKPHRVHLAELFADQEIMAYVTEHILGKKWQAISGQRSIQEQHLLCEIEYWYRMGYDYIRVIGGIDFPVSALQTADTAELSKGNRLWPDSHSTALNSWEDFERYPWPEVRDEDLWMYEFVAEHLPEGMGIMACPTSGFFEIACTMGYETLSYLIYDQPELVSAFVERAGRIVMDTYQKIMTAPQVIGFFQGDDMGYKTATMVSPEFLRKHILPWHKELAELAHRSGKAYLLHSCGQLDSIMKDLIEDVKIDAKQSFEDEIVPVEDFARQYGQEVGVLGGVPVDLLTRGSQEQVRQRVRHILEVCMPIGRYALGSGNSVANYTKPANFVAMLEEGLEFGDD